jgi:protein O-GlcNAc transferase
MRRLIPVLVGALLAGAASADALAALRRERTNEERLALQHHQSGRQLMREEHWDQAIEEFRQAIKLDPKLLMAHYDLGQALMATREYGAAIRAYLGCRDAFRDFAASMAANTLEAEAAREDRIRELRDDIRELQSLRVAPNTPQGIQIQLQMTQIENVIQSLERMRGQDPTTAAVPAEISLALGSAYFRNGELEEAEREYLAALAERPQLGQAHNNLAVVYLLLERPAEAKEQIKLAEKARFKVPSGLKDDVEKALLKQQGK